MSYAIQWPPGVEYDGGMPGWVGWAFNALLLYCALHALAVALEHKDP